MREHSRGPGRLAASLWIVWRSPCGLSIVAAGLLLLAALVALLDGRLVGTSSTRSVRSAAAAPAKSAARTDPGPALRSPRRDRADELAELLGVAQGEGSRFERLEAIASLGSSPGRLVEESLRDLLSDPDSDIRGATVESLAALGTNGAIEALALALHDQDRELRRCAAEFLVDLGTTEAIAALAVTLQEPERSVRVSVVYELADSESPAAIALLRRFLSDRDPKVRRAAELAF